MVLKIMIFFILFLAAPVIGYYGIFEIMPFIIQYSLILASLTLSFSILAFVYFFYIIARSGIEISMYGFRKINQLLQEMNSVSLRRGQNIRVVSRF